MVTNMSNIGELISNIYQYGNSKFYVQVPNPYSVCAMEFLVDENGVLNITRVLEEYDSPFWKGKEKNEYASLKEAIEVDKYSEKDFSIVISTIVYSSFYQGRVASLLTHEEVPPKGNTNMAVKKLYQMVYSMLQLSNADLTRWVLNVENTIENQLINKTFQNIPSEGIDSEQGIELVEEMRKEVAGRLINVENVWKKTQTIESDEEYVAACKQWDSLYDDFAIPEFSKPVKK